MFSFYAPKGSDKEKPVGLLAFFICPMAVSMGGLKRIGLKPEMSPGFV